MSQEDTFYQDGNFRLIAIWDVRLSEEERRKLLSEPPYLVRPDRLLGWDDEEFI